ncbi:hypothetical protein [Sphingomonas sp.]|uniref:hypothetical protein n=1 Tax=Sphingomonas sp. TaxID=28214 RepID=UPI003CC5AC4D
MVDAAERDGGGHAGHCHQRRALDQWLVTGEAVGIHIDRAMLANGVYQTARPQPITRGRGWTGF